MKKLVRNFTAAATAIAVATTMAAAASAACSHGAYGIRRGEPHYGGTHTHYHVDDIQCTVTSYVAVITTFCGYCGATINETVGTVSQHHSYQG